MANESYNVCLQLYIIYILIIIEVSRNDSSLQSVLFFLQLYAGLRRRKKGSEQIERKKKTGQEDRVSSEMKQGHFRNHNREENKEYTELSQHKSDF